MAVKVEHQSLSSARSALQVWSMQVRGHYPALYLHLVGDVKMYQMASKGNMD